MNKKGVSTIIITVLLVALVLAAVGIVWAVINNLIGKSTRETEIAGKCIGVDVRAKSVACSGEVCNITLERTGTSDDEIGGVKLVFKDSAAGNSSGIIDISGNIEKLVGKTQRNIDTNLTAPDSVEVTVYFIDEAGKERLCQSSSPFEF